ncbi:1 TM domain-containing transmembrane protein [Acrasis kona]|uniref:1 TM domain-containing transmembrane protein n=1 Tax=Acrasis kona TaxID=1008807 RepID=A0AAW2ZRU2_9EUKA
MYWDRKYSVCFALDNDENEGDENGGTPQVKLLYYGVNPQSVNVNKESANNGSSNNIPNVRIIIGIIIALLIAYLLM